LLNSDSGRDGVEKILVEAMLRRFWWRWHWAILVEVVLIRFWWR